MHGKTLPISRKGMCILLTMVLLLQTVWVLPRDQVTSAETEPPEQGDWIVTETLTVTNRTITLDGNLIIGPGGNLTLVNCTLLFNSSFDGEYGIEVRDGGRLNVIGRKEVGVGPGPPLPDALDRWLYVGAQDGRVYAFRNNASAGKPDWVSHGAIVDEHGTEIKVSSVSTPTLADLHGDGNLDLIIGMTSGELLFYRNLGNNSHPRWSRDEAMFAGIDVGWYSAPTFADLDGDGDLDLIIGEYNGPLHYYENTGTTSEPEWTRNDTMFAGVEVGRIAKPTFADLNGDGDLDLIVGSYEGPLYFYENTGTASHPTWTRNDTLFAGIDAGSYSAPTFADLDGDGDLDLIVGANSGMLSYYANTGTASGPEWTQDNTMFAGINIGSRSTPTFSPVLREEPGRGADGSTRANTRVRGSRFGGAGNDRGVSDLVIGMYDGSLTYYENTGSGTSPEWTWESAMFWGHNFGIGAVPTFGDLTGNGLLDLLVGRYQSGVGGSVVFMENTGTAREPQWTNRGNLIDSEGEVISISWFSNPFLADLDGDGLPDLTIGGHDGSIHFYRNTGTAQEPQWTGDSSVYAGVTAGSNCAPTLADIDGDGDLDLVVGDRDGRLRLYENTGDVSEPVWTDRGYLKDSSGQDIQVEGWGSTYNSAPAFVDLTGDGLPDLVVGDYNGNLHYYENTGTASDPVWTDRGLLKDRDGNDIKAGRSSKPAFADLGGREPEGPTHTVWYTRIAAAGNHTYDFVVRDGGVLQLKDMWITDCGNGTPEHPGLTVLTAEAHITGNLFGNMSTALRIEDVEGGDGFSVLNNTFVNNSRGIEAHRCRGILISGNTFPDNLRGIRLVNCTDVVVGMNIMEGTETGIIVEECGNATITGNTIAASDPPILLRGIRIVGGGGHTIMWNNITGTGEGITLRNSTGNTLIRNGLIRCGILIEGSRMEAWGSHFMDNNTVNESPLYYHVDVRDGVVPADAGSVILVNATNMTMTGLDMENTTVGIQLFLVNGSVVSDCAIVDSLAGIRLWGSSGNTILDTVITGNDAGIDIRHGSTDNTFRFNDISANVQWGLDASENGEYSVDARHNHWGGYHGPYHGTMNPGGDGDRITGNVLFTPWLRSPPGENVWYVDGSAVPGGDGRPTAPHQRIQDALDNASRWETVIVLPGRYHEQLVVTRPVEIRGDPGGVILDAGLGIGIHVRAEAARITGTPVATLPTATTVTMVTTVTNLTMVNATTDLVLEADTVLYNTTFDSVDFLKDRDLFVGHYLTVLTLDGDGSPIPGGEITVGNVRSETVRLFSDADGLASHLPLIGYVMNSTGITRLDPFRIDARHGVRYDKATLNLTSDTMVTLILSRRGGFGTGIARGDLTGDGADEYVVGAPFDGEGGWHSGAVFIFSGGGTAAFGKEIGTGDACITIPGASPWDHFGSSLVIGDFNGDGKNDLVVTAPGPGDLAAGTTGSIYLFPGTVLQTGNVGIADAVILSVDEPDLGQLITADIDGDGRADILAVNAIGVRVFHGAPGPGFDLPVSTFHGLRDPAVVTVDGRRTLAASHNGEVLLFSMEPDAYSLIELVDREDFTGSFNFTTYDGGLTIYPYERVGVIPNGDFAQGWDNWTRTESIRGLMDGTGDITTTPRGDWWVYEGMPTAGLGPDRDRVASTGGQGRNCDGKLVSDPFFLPEGVEIIDLWHHVKWWSFERANQSQYQDAMDDFISIRVVRDADDSIVAEQYYGLDHGGANGERHGRLQFDVSGEQGVLLRIVMELSNNLPAQDDGLVQIADIVGLRKTPEARGDFVSHPVDSGVTAGALLAHWEAELNGGSMGISFRTNITHPWTPIPRGTFVELPGNEEDFFQYRVTMEAASGEEYPVLRELHFDLYDPAPVSMGDGTPYNGGGIFEDNTLVIVNGTRAALHNGTVPEFLITSTDRIETLAAIGDVDGNGVGDLIISSNDTVYLVLLDGTGGSLDLEDVPFTFTGAGGFGRYLHRNLVGSPLEQRGDGRVYVLPLHLNDSAILGVDIGDQSLVYPDSVLVMNLSLINIGLHDMDPLDVVMNITGDDGYVHESTVRIAIRSWENAQIGFTWNVPAWEGVRYTVNFMLPPDHDASNNHLSVTLTARHHSLAVATQKDYDAMAPGGVLWYGIEVADHGTFGSDLVTFHLEPDLPGQGDWEWWMRHDGENVTQVPVEGAVHLDLFVRPTTLELGAYFMNLTAVSRNGFTTATLTLAGHIVLADLVPTGVRVLRSDGKEASPVADDDTTLILSVRNAGSQDTGFFNTALEMGGMAPDLQPGAPLPGGSTVNITFVRRFAEGIHDLTFTVDPEDAVKEYNETNNIFALRITVLPGIAESGYTFTIRIVDLNGRNVTGAQVKATGPEVLLESVTGEEGNTTMLLDPPYREGSRFLVEAFLPNLYGRTEVPVFSEDGGVNLILPVGRYSFDVRIGNRDRDIPPGGDQSFTFTLTNTGVFTDRFSLSLAALPGQWSSRFTGDGLTDDTLILGPGRTGTFTLIVTSHIYAPAHHRYEPVLTVTSLGAPFVRENIRLRLSVTLVENITFTSDTLHEHGLPGDPITHRVWLNNTGNAQRSVTLFVSGDTRYCTLREQDREFTLAIGARRVVLFVIEVPNLRNGTVLRHQLLGVVSGVGSTPVLEFTTVIDPTSTGYYDVRIEGQDLMITHRGNRQDQLSITLTSAVAEIGLDPASFLIDMGETVRARMTLTTNDPTVPAGTTVPVFISLFNGERYFINQTRPVVVPPVHDIMLSVTETTIRAVPGSLVEVVVHVRNAGNTGTTVFFTGTNSGPEPLILPSPVPLPRNHETTVLMRLRLPAGVRTPRFITFGAEAGSVVRTLEITVDPTVTRSLELVEISARTGDGGTRYTMNLYNTGESVEVVNITADCGDIELLQARIRPKEHVQFHLLMPHGIFCGDTIEVIATSLHGVGVSASVTLTPPPHVTVEIVSPLPATVAAPVRFRADGAYASYHWTVGGTTLYGAEVSHTFTSSGLQSVKLVVTDSRGISSTFITGIIIENLPPVIETRSAIMGTAGDHIGFDARRSYDPDGTIVGFQWLIEDRTYPGPHVFHRFSRAGTYNVTLMVTDDDGAMAMLNVTATIRGTETKHPGTIENREIDTRVVGISLFLLVIAIGGVLFLLSRMGPPKNAIPDTVPDREGFVMGTGAQEGGLPFPGSHGDRTIPPLTDPPASLSLEVLVSPLTPQLSCQNCSNRVPAYFRFCNRCGFRFEEVVAPVGPAEVEERLCGQCGHGVPAYFRYCNRCGSRFEDGSTTS